MSSEINVDKSPSILQHLFNSNEVEENGGCYIFFPHFFKTRFRMANTANIVELMGTEMLSNYSNQNMFLYMS